MSFFFVIYFSIAFKQRKNYARKKLVSWLVRSCCHPIRDLFYLVLRAERNELLLLIFLLVFLEKKCVLMFVLLIILSWPHKHTPISICSFYTNPRSHTKDIDPKEPAYSFFYRYFKSSIRRWTTQFSIVNVYIRTNLPTDIRFFCVF